MIPGGLLPCSVEVRGYSDRAGGSHSRGLPPQTCEEFVLDVCSAELLPPWFLKEAGAVSYSGAGLALKAQSTPCETLLAATES